MPNTKGYRSPSQLLAAKQSQQYKVVKLLVEAGSKVNTQDNEGNTPLHYQLCASTPNFKVIRYLLANAADLTIKNVAGVTPQDVITKRNMDIATGVCDPPTYVRLH